VSTITEPRERTGPRFLGNLGRRLSLILLPLVLIPLLITGAAAYFRARALLENQISMQMSSSLESQIGDLSVWTTTREIRIQSDAARAPLTNYIVSLQKYADGSQSYTDTIESLNETLSSFLVQRSARLFDDLLIIRTDDGTILASTNPLWESSELEADILSRMPTSSYRSLPIYNHPLFGPFSLSFLTIAPIQTDNADQSNALLIGVTSGMRVLRILSNIEASWEHFDYPNTSNAETFITLFPDTLLRVHRFGLSPVAEGSALPPVFEMTESQILESQRYRNINLIPVLGTYSWLPQLEMGIIVEVPQSVIYKEINALTPFFIALFLGSAFLALLIVFLTSSRLLRPLQSLTEFAQRISQGDWQYRVPVDRDDEVGLLAHAFNRMAKELSLLYRSLEDRVDERTKHLRTAAQVARAVVSTPSLEDLLNRAVYLIQEQFGYQHASIFLLDEEGNNAVLRSSTGELGSALKARQHQVVVGSESIIGWVTANNRPRYASLTDPNSDAPMDRIFPDSESEATVPLQVGGRVLGALDVHSIGIDAFSQQDIEVLQTLADQLSAAIQNARLARASVAAAERARMVSELSSDLSGSLGVEEVLRKTAISLQSTLGQTEIMVYIQSPERDGISDES
jgi:HAMP domain-containing protein